MLRQLRPIDQTAINGSLYMALSRVQADLGFVESFIVRWVKERFVIKIGELIIKYLKQDGYL